MDKHTKIAAIIPARMASTRFPGKPLIEVEGLPLVLHPNGCAEFRVADDHDVHRPATVLPRVERVVLHQPIVDQGPDGEEKKQNEYEPMLQMCFTPRTPAKPFRKPLPGNHE